jgi:hypothetical protein
VRASLGLPTSPTPPVVSHAGPPDARPAAYPDIPLTEEGEAGVALGRPVGVVQGEAVPRGGTREWRARQEDVRLQEALGRSASGR